MASVQSFYVLRCWEIKRRKYRNEENINKLFIVVSAILLHSKFASINPLAYCEGGFYGGHLGLHDKIKPLLKSATASFGITALNELQELHNGKSLVEDGEFALEVMKYINKTWHFLAKCGLVFFIYFFINNVNIY